MLTPLSIPANVFAYKAIAAVSSLAVIALVWNGARLRGIDQVRAVALVGLNPLIVVYGVGGGHNDLLMLVLLLAGVVFLLQRRERLGGGSLVAAAAIKVTAGLMLPFALAGARGPDGPLYLSRRRNLLVGAGVAVAVLVVFTFAMFGTGPLHLPGTIATVQGKGNWQSIPGFIGTRLGLGTVSHSTALILGALFAVALVWLTRRVWRGQLDWIAGAGWASIALARDRRLAPALVRGLGDAARRTRARRTPVEGLAGAHVRDRLLPGPRLHPARQRGAGTVTSLPAARRGRAGRTGRRRAGRSSCSAWSRRSTTRWRRSSSSTPGSAPPWRACSSRSSWSTTAPPTARTPSSRSSPAPTRAFASSSSRATSAIRPR